VSPRLKTAAATGTLIALFLGGAWATVDGGQHETPWMDPLPQWAVDQGYNDFRDESAGWALPGYAAWRIAQDPPRGDGPLIIDRVHSSKQPHDSHLDSDDYGYSTMFGLGRAFEPIREEGVALQEEYRALDAGALAGASAVFVNLPSGDNAPFGQHEIEALDAFVQAGGGLVVVADHTDCYFHAEQLAPLTRRLGVELPPTTACDIPPNTLSVKTRAWLHVTDVREHPVTRQVEALGVATAAEVLGPAAWTPLFWTSPGGWSDVWDPYRKPQSAGFTGDLEQHEGEESRPVVMASAGSHGQGRVVFLGDQNMLGSALIGVEDNARLFGNAIGWAMGLDLPVPVRGPGSVTTLTGDSSLCTSWVPEGYRTFSVQLMRLGRHHLTPEFCTRVGEVESERLVVLPDAMHPKLDALVKQAELSLIMATPELAERLGLVLGERTEVTGVEGDLASPFPDHPVWSAETAPLTVRPYGYEGGEVLLSAGGAPLLVRDGDLLVVLDPALFTQQRMGGEREKPWTKPELARHHQVAFQVLNLLF